MRILFTTSTSASQLLPLVPLAWALTAAGHDVRVAAPPSLAPAIRSAGLLGVVTGPDIDRVEAFRRAGSGRQGGGGQPDPRRSQPWRPGGPPPLEVYLGGAAVMAEAMVPDLLDFARWWRPDLVVYGPLAFAGRLAAAVAGVPAVRHLWGIGDFLAAWGLDGCPVGPLADLFDRHGVPDVDVNGALTIDPSPEELREPAGYERLAMRPVPYNGSGLAPSWLTRPGALPRVCATWGTTVPALGRAMFSPRPLIAALAGLPVEVILAVPAGQRENLGELPNRFRVVESLPLGLVLPDCDVLISQGGQGTLVSALCAGLPQLVLPILADQVYNAQRLARTGAAAVLYHESVDEASLGEQVTRLLEDGDARVAARRLSAQARTQPTPAHLAAQLPEVLGGLLAAHR
jgi:UDP:flavonoid glycosyltransferase YjiC (YdhE family)